MIHTAGRTKILRAESGRMTNMQTSNALSNLQPEMLSTVLFSGDILSLSYILLHDQPITATVPVAAT